MILLREADERLWLIESIASQIHDLRQQDKIRHPIDKLLLERIFSRSLGYDAEDEVDLLSQDPAVRIPTWNRPSESVIKQRNTNEVPPAELVASGIRHEGS